MTPSLASLTRIYALALSTVCAATLPPLAVAVEQLNPLPWEQTKAMLNRASSVWNAPPANVVRPNMTRGPLIGNGGVGVTATSDIRSLSFLISHNGFICETYRPTPVRIGGLTIALAEPSADKTPSKHFRMEQYLTQAEIRTTLERGCSVRTFVAATRDVLISELSNATDKPLALRISTWTPPATKVFPASVGVQGDAAWASRDTYSGLFTPEQTDGKPRRKIQTRWVSRAVLGTRILGAESRTELDEKANTATHTLTLAPGQKIQVATQIGMVRGDSPLAPTLATIARDTAQSLEQLKTAHDAWWKAFWGKSQVVLNDAEIERYYYSALYILACANRAGQDAPGLYGSWITTDGPLWASDIHLNYNGLMPYAGVYSSNRPELARPLTTAMLAMVPEGRRRAKEDAEYIHPSLKGKSFSGILYPVGICSSLGVAACDRYLKQVYDASYAAMQFIEQYEYTQDDVFLKSEAYPFVLACGDFWESYLDTTEVNGRKQYTFWGGTSENVWAPTPSTDIGYIQRIFSFLISNSKTLGVDQSRRAKWQDILGHLPPLPTVIRNGKTCIAWDATGLFRPEGANAFGVDCIYPGNALNLESPPESLKLAQDTVSAYKAWGQMNNVPRIFLSHLRVGADPDDTRKAFFALVKHRMGPNTIIVDRYHGMEKCGGVEVVNRLLLNSDAFVLRFFDAWDLKQDAAFRNFLARGAFLVSADLKGGVVSGVRILSGKGRECAIVNPWPGRKVQLVRNGKKAETRTGERLTFKTVAGETIELSRE